MVPAEKEPLDEPRVRDVLTVKQAAEFLQVSEETIRRRALRGEMPAAKVGRGWRFSQRQLMSWIERGGVLYEEVVDQSLAEEADRRLNDPDNQERMPLAAVKARLGL